MAGMTPTCVQPALHDAPPVSWALPIAMAAPIVMCGWPPAGKGYFAFCRRQPLAVMCPASHEGILVKLFHHAPPRLGSKYRGQVSSKVEPSSAQDLPANLTSGGTLSPPRSRIRDRRAPGERHHSMRRHLRTRPDNGDAPLDPWARAAPQPRPMSGQSGRGLHDRPLRQHALGCEPPQSDQ
jgi:hypothetical protein